MPTSSPHLCTTRDHDFILVCPCLFTHLSPSGALSALSLRLRAGSRVFMTCKGWLKGWQEVRGKYRAPVCSLSVLSLCRSRSHALWFPLNPHSSSSTNLGLLLPSSALLFKSILKAKHPVAIWPDVTCPSSQKKELNREGSRGLVSCV